jgi:hypothetical protein
LSRNGFLSSLFFFIPAERRSRIRTFSTTASAGMRRIAKEPFDAESELHDFQNSFPLAASTRQRACSLRPPAHHGRHPRAPWWPLQVRQPDST